MKDDQNPWTASRGKKETKARNLSYVRVATADEIPPGTMKQINTAAEPVVVANISGAYYAFESLCPHEGAALHDGTLYGTVIDCPRHHYTFDLISGQNLYPKRSFPPDLASRLPCLQVYPVRIEQNQILVGFFQE